MAGLTRRYDFLTTISSYCNELGWGNYANDHEDANGQFEQNFTYDDALVSCDRAIFFRYMVHTLAEQHGMIATFMPKPFTHLTGNGCHFHMSLWRDGENAFLDEADPRGLGLSETAYHFIGGLMAHARASSALTAPTVNSYKRLKLGSTVERRDVVARLDLLRLQQPHADAADPGPRADRGPHDRRLGEPVPGRRGRARRRARRDRAASSTPDEPNAENLYAPRGRGPDVARVCSGCPANLLEAIGELERDDVLRVGARAAGAARTTSTTTRGSSATSGSATTSRSRRGSSGST